MPRSCADVVLPHLDAAFNDARWLTHQEADAEDVVQDGRRGHANGWRATGHPRAEWRARGLS